MIKKSGCLFSIFKILLLIPLFKLIKNFFNKSTNNLPINQQNQHTLPQPTQPQVVKCQYCGSSNPVGNVNCQCCHAPLN